MRLVVNFLLFQLTWFACVLGAAHGMPWLGPLAVSLFLVFHLTRAPRPAAEVRLLAGAALTGALFDSLLAASGWLAYPSGQWHPALAPYWIVAMWVGFAATLNVSLAWLKRRPVVAGLFGIVGGPLAYLAGSKLGGVELVDPTAALLALGVGWGLIMPVLLRLAERFDGWRPHPGSRMLAAATE